jgi:signal peptidase II
MWDRITRGYVIDFLDFHVGSGPSWHFPIFNLADSAICIGVVLLAVIGSRQQVPRPEATAVLKEKP